MKFKKLPWKKPKKPERLSTATYLKGRAEMCRDGDANCRSCPLGILDDGNCIRIEIQNPDFAVEIVAAWLEAGHENT